MKKLNRLKVIEKIKSARNKIFGAEFVKKNGERRTGAFRLGVTKYLKGGQNKVVRPDNSYLTVFDMKKKEYRTLNLKTLLRLKIDGVEYEIVD